MTMIIEHFVNVFHNAYHAGNSRQTKPKKKKSCRRKSNKHKEAASSCQANDDQDDETKIKGRSDLKTPNHPCSDRERKAGKDDQTISKKKKTRKRPNCLRKSAKKHSLAPKKPEPATEDVTTVAQTEDGLTTASQDAAESEPIRTTTKKKLEDSDNGDYLPRVIRDILNPSISYITQDTSSRLGVRRGVLIVQNIQSLGQIQYVDSLKRLETYATIFMCRYMTCTELAHAGFISVSSHGTSSTSSSRDQVLCVWCGLTLWTFVEHVNALALHQTHSHESCKFLKEILPVERKQEGTSTANTNARQASRLNRGNIVAVHSSGNLMVSSSAANDSVIEKYQRLHKLNLEGVFQEVSAVSFRQTLPAMRYERNRRLTFHSSALSDQAVIMAAEGFYLKGQWIVCGICNVEILKVPEFTTLQELHEVHHSMRRLCFLEGNVPDLFGDSWLKRSSTDLEEIDSDLTGLEGLGVNTAPSKYKEMAVEDRRLDSYLTHPRPSELDVAECAKAGLFYNGKHELNEDALLCFHCGAVMHTWRVNEDPWIRHARTSPTCQFLILHKGQDYIDRVLEQHGNYQTPTRENRINNVTTRMLRPRMDAPVVQKALYDLRLNRDQVKEVISNRIKSSEQDFTSLTELIRAIEQSNQARQPPGFSDATPNLPFYEMIADNSAFQPSIVIPGARPTSAPGSASISRAASTVSLHREDSEETRAPGEEINPAEATTQLTCKVCLSNLVGIIFLPCGHLVCCTECAPAMSQCPICRHDVKGTIRAHINGQLTP